MKRKRDRESASKVSRMTAKEWLAFSEKVKKDAADRWAKRIKKHRNNSKKENDIEQNKSGNALINKTITPQDLEGRNNSQKINEKIQ